LNGRLREKPTFIVNFKLSFGVLIFYYEIPQRFVPYLVQRKKGKRNPNPIDNDNHNNNNDNINGTEISTTTTTPGDRAICRFLAGNDRYRNSKLKLIPNIVDGPWIAKTAVPSNKPSIIGNKVPVSYTYGPPAEIVVSKNNKRTATSSSSSSSSSSTTSLAPYLEADLDIAGSSKSAKAIMNVCLSYTKSITVDLGFVVQGNRQDELPEQMLVGTRLHKIDPYTAPSYPNPN